MRRFNFSRNGHANRRDRDAVPRVLLLRIEGDHAFVHVAGEQYERAVTVSEIDADLIAGMAPEDAFRVGVAKGASAV